MPSYTQKLIEALKHPDPKVRSDAAWVLGQRKEKGAVKDLILALEDNKNDPYLLGIIAESLGYIGEKEALPQLFDLLHTSFLPVRVKSAVALAGIGDRRAIPHLNLALIDSNANVREAAKWALKRLTASP